MSTASLTNLTVPIGDNGVSQGLLMPKLSYRFRVFFENFGVSTPTTELTKQVMTFARPQVSFEEIKLPIYNSTIKIAGKYTWADVTCDLRDDAQGSVSKLVGEQLQKQLDFMEQSSASSGIDYKFTTVLEMIDGGNAANAPVILEKWQMIGCYLKDVNYNGLDYGTSEAVKITLSITFDNAVQDAGGAVGVPGAVTRTNGNNTTGAGAAA